MSDTYTPPKVWKWESESGGRFAKINRPVAGATHEKDLPVGEHPLQLYSLATPNGVKVTAMLEELGYEVHKANTAADALAQFEEHSRDIALVILDVIMPHVSGPELLERFQTISPEVPVLLSRSTSTSPSLSLTILA